MKTRLLAFLLLILTGHAQAQLSELTLVEKQRAIELKRSELTAKKQAVADAHAKLQEQCWQRFAVNDCLRDVRRAQRKALEPVEAALLELIASDRLLRLQEREQRLLDKAHH
ncbi:MAG: hypothetical protein RIS04_1015 [Pseudomonadota bacterium]|jgi:hypothetical protein